MRTKKRAQSAMEYLMTYGWAILIIAVVLGALYQLGIFNPSTFQGKAQPGNCQVLRPNGPNTTQFISLQGVCNGQPPQFVAQFSGQSTSTVANIPDANFPLGTNAVSVFAWIKSTQTANYPFIFNYGKYGIISQDLLLGYYNGCINADYWGSGQCAGSLVNDGAWHFVGVSFSGGSTAASIYVDGNMYSVTLGGIPNLQNGAGTIANIGYGTTQFFSGSISNVQIYNTSISANAAKAMYTAGIGGAPIRLQNLVGWWPLNGNAKDYSGNLDNGVASNVVFSGTWTK